MVTFNGTSLLNWQKAAPLINSIAPDTKILTYNVKESEQLAKEVAIGPPVVILQVVIQIVQKEFLLLLFLHLGDNSDVEIHHEGGNFAGLPVLP